MPPCMVRHLETSDYQSLSLSDLEWVLILTGASVSKSSLMLTLNNAAQSSETILVAELQQWHTSAPTSCLLISMLNLAHLNRPVELRCVSAASGVMDFMDTFLMHQQRTFSELGFLQVLVFLPQKADTGLIRLFCVRQSSHLTYVFSILTMSLKNWLSPAFLQVIWKMISCCPPVDRVPLDFTSLKFCSITLNITHSPQRWARLQSFDFVFGCASKLEKVLCRFKWESEETDHSSEIFKPC